MAEYKQTKNGDDTRVVAVITTLDGEVHCFDTKRGDITITDDYIRFHWIRRINCLNVDRDFEEVLYTKYITSKTITIDVKSTPMIEITTGMDMERKFEPAPDFEEDNDG